MGMQFRLTIFSRFSLALPHQYMVVHGLKDQRKLGIISTIKMATLKLYTGEQSGAAPHYNTFS